MKYLTPNPHINMGDTGKIVCKARGYPLPEIYWQLKDGKTETELSAGKEYRGRFSVSATQQDHSEEWSMSVLTIRSLQVKDWKINFTCMASNDQASYYRDFHLTGFSKSHLEILMFSINSILCYLQLLISQLLFPINSYSH